MFSCFAAQTARRPSLDRWRPGWPHSTAADLEPTHQRLRNRPQACIAPRAAPNSHLGPAWKAGGGTSSIDPSRLACDSSSASQAQHWQHQKENDTSRRRAASRALCCSGYRRRTTVVSPNASGLQGGRRGTAGIRGTAPFLFPSCDCLFIMIL